MVGSSASLSRLEHPAPFILSINRELRAQRYHGPRGSLMFCPLSDSATEDGVLGRGHSMASCKTTTACIHRFQ